jgi:hypothetical protein
LAPTLHPTSGEAKYSKASVFFFEKKKQKTFFPWRPWLETERSAGRHALKKTLVLFFKKEQCLPAQQERPGGRQCGASSPSCCC